MDPESEASWRPRGGTGLWEGGGRAATSEPKPLRCRAPQLRDIVNQHIGTHLRKPALVATLFLDDLHEDLVKYMEVAIPLPDNPSFHVLFVLLLIVHAAHDE